MLGSRVKAITFGYMLGIISKGQATSVSEHEHRIGQRSRWVEGVCLKSFESSGWQGKGMNSSRIPSASGLQNKALLKWESLDLQEQK